MEIWRDVVGYEGLYRVSDLGQVRSMTRRTIGHNGVAQVRTGRVLKQGRSSPSYRRVVLYGLNPAEKARGFSVHRLVWSAFRGPIPEGLEINHKDFDRTNNRLSNLELMTPSQNVMYSVDAGRWGDTRGEKNGVSLLTDEEVILMRKLYDEGWTLKQLNRRFGVRCAWDVVSGGSWGHLPLCKTKPVSRGHSERHARGERVNTAKLTKEDVIEIRAMHASGQYSYRRLSRLYDVSSPSIQAIVKRETWKHVL